MSHFRLSVSLFAVFTLLTACNTTQQSTQPAAPPDTRAADEAAIRAIDVEWAKAAAAKDLAGTTAYYTDSTQVFAPNAPAATGKDAIQKTFTTLMALPGFALIFAPSKVEVARSATSPTRPENTK